MVLCAQSTTQDYIRVIVVVAVVVIVVIIVVVVVLIVVEVVEGEKQKQKKKKHNNTNNIQRQQVNSPSLMNSLVCVINNSLNPITNRWFSRFFRNRKSLRVFCKTPRQVGNVRLEPIAHWEAADTEVKVAFGGNTELKRPPFKAWSR